MTTIACSACRTILPAGSAFCPGCGLQLTAQAVPVVQPPRSIFVSALIAAGVILLIAVIGAIVSNFAH